jgi:hypothetical protein
MKIDVLSCEIVKCQSDEMEMDYILVKGAYYPYLAEREVAEWARGMK